MSRHIATQGLRGRSIAQQVRAIPKRAVVGICLAATLLCAGCIGLWTTQAPADPGQPGGAPSASTSAGASTSASASTIASTTEPGARRQMITVAVVGHVRFPGLVRAPEGLRVVEAVTRAGGLTPEGVWDGLNLAQKVSDGQQIVVGSAGKAGSIIGGQTGQAGQAGQTGQAQTSQTDGGASESGKVNINRASAVELETITGVGPKLAAAIVEYRTSHGPFASIDQLSEVKGIGPAKLASIREQVVL